jgi:ribosome assembly protein 1
MLVYQSIVYHYFFLLIDIVTCYVIKHGGRLSQLHLERCIKDLKDRFAKIDIRVSEPVAVFRETVVPIENSRVPVRQKILDVDLDILDHFHRSSSTNATDADTDDGGAVEDDVRSSHGAHGGGGDTASVASGAAHSTASGVGGTSEVGNKLKRVKVGKWGQVVASTPNHAIRIFLRVQPLPQVIITAIEANRVGLEVLVKDEARGAEFTDDNNNSNNKKDTVRVTARADARTLARQALAKVKEAFTAAGPAWAAEFDSVWALGPHGVGPCVLLSHLTEAHCGFSGVLDLFESTRFGRVGGAEARLSLSNIGSSLTNSILAGFQMATRAGPLCEEPMWGVAVTIEAIRLSVAGVGGDAGLVEQEGIASLSIDEDEAIEASSIQLHDVEQLLRSQSGQMISAVKDAVRRGMSAHHEQDKHGVATECGVRLAEGYLRCELQCHVNFQDGDQLGKLYSVLAKRRAKIVREDMWEGTSIFTIEALIPVVEAFGLADDLRIKTSGMCAA